MIKKKPEHIGIIPDGNRRWAGNRGMEKQEGYRYGLDPGMRLLQLAKQAGIKEITYYGYTVDNCKRPREQFAAFQRALLRKNPDLRRRNQGEFPGQLRVEMGFIPYAAGRTALF